MNKTALIFGAGAIGRGFLAPLLFEHGYKISFVDINKKLINQLKGRDFYITAETNKKDYNYKKIKINKAYHVSEKIKIEKYDIVFCCVGPNESKSIAHKFKKAKVVISCENIFFPILLKKNFKK